METLSARILEELKAIGFARATDALAVTDGALTVKDTDSLPPQLQAAVASIEKGTGGVKLKFYDKLKALELMGKILGMFEGASGVQVEENNLLETLLNATKEVDAGDIPELQQAAETCHAVVEPEGAEGI